MLRVVIDPERPNLRQLDRVAKILREGGIIAYPTDTVYGLGCDMTQKRSVEKIYAMKGKNRKHPLSFICPDLKDISTYAIVSNHAFRIMKRILPGPYTVILPASREVPRLMMSKSVTVGIRIPDHPVPLYLSEALGNPIVTTSIPSEDIYESNDPEVICRRMPLLDAIVDCGLIHPEPSTVLDFTTDAPRLLRQGKGSTSGIQLYE